MYTVSKDGSRVVITDWKGQVVYSAEGESLVVYQIANEKRIARIMALTDEQLILSLVNSIKIQL